MSLAQPCPPLLNSSSHERCLRCITIVRSFGDNRYEFVDVRPALSGPLTGNREKVADVIEGGQY